MSSMLLTARFGNELWRESMIFLVDTLAGTEQLRPLVFGLIDGALVARQIAAYALEYHSDDLDDSVVRDAYADAERRASARLALLTADPD